MNGSQLYLLASSSYGTWLNCRCGPFCHTASRSRNLTETGAMDANCHHRTCQRASVVSSTATTLPCHVTVFKYQQRRGYETELIARMAAGFIVIQQPESRRKWILSGDTWEFNTASHKETSAMLPRFPEAGTCSDLSLTGAFISFEIVVVVLADKNLYLPVFFSAGRIWDFYLPRLDLYLKGIPAGLFSFSFPLAISALICFTNGHHNIKLI